MSIKPTKDFILLKEEETRETSSNGIILPSEKGDVEIGNVLAVGESVSVCSPMDTILFLKSDAKSYKQAGETLYLLKGEHVLALLKD